MPATYDEDLDTREQTGLARQDALPPASLAAQQRAQTEVQAALTIAKRFPRDEMLALDKIITSCQRLRVAEECEYDYSKGGTAIEGASIRLMEVIAQHWGNVEFGFREVARFDGESIVEAFAWDLQSNTRRKVEFSVKHEMGLKGGGIKKLKDPRDIYEHVANNAQRRVRTCLENIIPRDIVDEARDQCHKTLKEKAPVTPDGIKNLVQSFEAFGVTKDDIEVRLQRRIDAITPAQFAAMRRVYKSLKEGMSRAEDWFKPDPAAAGTKARPSDLNEKLQPKAVTPEAAPKEPQPDASQQSYVYEGAKAAISKAKTPPAVGKVMNDADGKVSQDQWADLVERAESRREEIINTKEE